MRAGDEDHCALKFRKKSITNSFCWQLLISDVHGQDEDEAFSYPELHCRCLGLGLRNGAWMLLASLRDLASQAARSVSSSSFGKT